MKNISILINIVLALAVSVLYYLHFSQKNNNNVSSAKTFASPANPSTLKIAYLNLDSLNKYITYIKTNKEKFENEQKDIEATIENEIKKFEQQKSDFQNKFSGSSQPTQQELEQMQNTLYQQQQAIETKKQSLAQALSEKSSKFMEDIEKKLKEFLGNYNKDKKYSFIFNVGSGFEYMSIKDSTMDISKDVIEGMNKILDK
jgi:outer membrane protein